LDSKGIDIILGMDWLRKYYKVILCAKRAVRLTTENGTTVEFSAVMTIDQSSLLNQVHGNSLEEIRVVQEYPDVFLEDKKGMNDLMHVSLKQIQLLMTFDKYKLLLL
jgi:hypothetical protein